MAGSFDYKLNSRELVVSFELECTGNSLSSMDVDGSDRFKRERSSFKLSLSILNF